MALTGLRKLLKQTPSGRGAVSVTRKVSNADWERVERWLIKGYSFKQIFGIVHAQVPQNTVGAFSQAFYVWEKSKRKKRSKAVKVAPHKRITKKHTITVAPHKRTVKKARKKKKVTQAVLNGLKKARAARASKALRRRNGGDPPTHSKALAQ